MRVGFGYDSHRLIEGRRMILGGLEIPCDKGPLGHSDADVLIHAICDAVLGAIGAGDIGRHFPDTDPAYKDIASTKLLHRVNVLAKEKGFVINNLDTTIVLEKPKLARHIPEMIGNISGVLDMPADRINIKAKTNEGMGFLGKEEGVVAFAVVTVMEKDSI